MEERKKRYEGLIDINKIYLERKPRLNIYS